MRDHLNGGRSAWPTPSPLDIMLRIEGKLGALQAGQDATRDEMRTGLHRIERKTDHAHARSTRLEGRVERLETASGPRRTDTPEDSPRGLTGLLMALGAVLPPLSTLALLIAWLTVALTAGIKAEMVQALIGLGP